MEVLAGFISGVFCLLGYMVYRMMRNPGWDDSNVLNALRLISHVTMHAPDFGKMQYPDGTFPFWYINLDEFSEVVKTRPQERE